MKLEKQVCSLELAKKLKELEIKQKSLWYWYKSNIDNEWKLTDDKPDFVSILRDNQPNRLLSAFTVAELGEMLPKIVEDEIEGLNIQFEVMIIRPIDCLAPQWDILYISPLKGKDILIEIGANTLANVMAKMLIHLLENKFIGGR